MIIDSHTHVVPEFLKLDRATYLDRDTTFGTLHRNTKIPLATSQDLLESMDEEEVAAEIGNKGYPAKKAQQISRRIGPGR